MTAWWHKRIGIPEKCSNSTSLWCESQTHLRMAVHLRNSATPGELEKHRNFTSLLCESQMLSEFADELSWVNVHLQERLDMLAAQQQKKIDAPEAYVKPTIAGNVTSVSMNVNDASMAGGFEGSKVEVSALQTLLLSALYPRLWNDVGICAKIILLLRLHACGEVGRNQEGVCTDSSQSRKLCCRSATCAGPRLWWRVHKIAFSEMHLFYWCYSLLWRNQHGECNESRYPNTRCFPHVSLVAGVLLFVYYHGIYRQCVMPRYLLMSFLARYSWLAHWILVLLIPQAWRLRAAELTRVMEEKDAAEKKLKHELKIRAQEVQALREELVKL